MKDKISTLQIGFITWQIILAAFIGIVPYILFYKLRQDSWLSIILAFILGFITIFIYLYIWNKKPELNIFEKNRFAFGKFLGNIINFILMISSLLLTVLYFYNMVNFITSQYLIKTPNIFIVFIFMIPIIYLISQKLDVIGRTIFVFGIISILLFTLTIVGLFNQADIFKLFPIGEHGFFNIFQGAFYCIPYTQFILFLLLCIPKSSVIDKQKLNKQVIFFYIFGYLIMWLGITLMTTVLGGELAMIYQYPEYQVLKRVSLIGFIERIESTLSIRWILYMITAAITGLYFTKVYCKTTFKLQGKENILIVIITIITLFCSPWLFPNNTVANSIIINTIPLILYGLFLVIPIILAIILKFKNS